MGTDATDCLGCIKLIGGGIRKIQTVRDIYFKIFSYDLIVGEDDAPLQSSDLNLIEHPWNGYRSRMTMLKAESVSLISFMHYVHIVRR